MSVTWKPMSCFYCISAPTQPFVLHLEIDRRLTADAGFSSVQVHLSDPNKSRLKLKAH